jgi:hypothetical protein
MDQIALAKLKDAEPEEFYLVTVDMDRAVVTKIETGLNEKRVREHFSKQQIPESEVDNRIAAVRKKPV